MAKIFVSYTTRDQAWAHWIAVTLRDNGHQPFVDRWEIGTGQNIPRWTEKRVKAADHLLGVFTDSYIKALHASTERWTAYWLDPDGRDGFLVPVEVEAVSAWPPLARPLKRLSLIGKSEREADFLRPPSAPNERPPFPGSVRTTVDQKGDGVDEPRSVVFADKSEPLPESRPSLPSTNPNLRTNPEPPRDHTELETWLKSRPWDWSIVTATRTALRVLPLMDTWPDGTPENAILLAFRAVAVVRLSLIDLGDDFTNAFARATNFAVKAIDAAVDAAGKRGDFSATVAAARGAASTALVPAEAAAGFAATDFAARRAIAAIPDIQLREKVARALNDAVHFDGMRSRLGNTSEELARMPLWSGATGGMPLEARANWGRLSKRLSHFGNHWQVWSNWYDQELAGSPPSPVHSPAWEGAFTDTTGPLPWAIYFTARIAERRERRIRICACIAANIGPLALALIFLFPNLHRVQTYRHLNEIDRGQNLNLSHSRVESFEE